MLLTETLAHVKEAALPLSVLTEGEKNAFLMALAGRIRSNVSDILTENAKDLARMASSNPMYDRLLLNTDRVEGLANDIERIAALNDPIGELLETRTRPNGLVIEKVRVPLGVVAVIYESRPNVTLDVFSLCFKTGNACLLKGGKEAHSSNHILVSLIQRTLEDHGLPVHSVALLSLDREETKDVLKAEGMIDVCIPRGSEALIRFVREHALVPVIETGAGVVHVYFDEDADLQKGKEIVTNAKTRRVSVCNALDCLVLHESRLGDLPAVLAPLGDRGVEVYADAPSYSIAKEHYPSSLLLTEEEGIYGREFLSHKMAIKTVGSFEEGLSHIARHTSGHTEAIITENTIRAQIFAQTIDAAVVCINASTSFTDGGEFGMGAEVGVSTQKLHARGPMGLEALTSYKWIVRGTGQIRP